MSIHTQISKPFYNIEIPIDWDIKSTEDVIHDLRGGAPLAPEDFTEKGFKVLPKSGVCHGGILRIKDDEQQYCSNDYAKKHSSNTINHLFTIIVLRDLVPAGPNIGLMVKYDSNEDYILAQGVYAFKIKENLIDDNFLIQYSNGQNYRKLMQQLKVGSTQVHITNTEFLKIKFPLPPLPEQKAIAHILCKADATIHITEKLIAQKELRKKWLMQQLLTGKKRLKGFGGEWKEIHIRDVAKEISIRNKSDKQLTVLSCTKYDGLVPSLEYFGRKIFADDVSTYKIVPKNHFAYATNHIEEGSIGYQEILDEALISPMYTVFKTDKTVNDNFFYKLLKSHSLVYQYQNRMEGSIDRRGGLRWDGFSIIKIKLPLYEEQTAIAQVLQAANKEISLLKAKAEKLREQKKGLMQQLLTGKVRLKIK